MAAYLDTLQATEAAVVVSLLADCRVITSATKVHGSQSLTQQIVSMCGRCPRGAALGRCELSVCVVVKSPLTLIQIQSIKGVSNILKSVQKVQLTKLLFAAEPASSKVGAIRSSWQLFPPILTG